MKATIAKKSTANPRKDHNVEKVAYIQWVTTLSLTIRVSSSA